MGTSTDKYVKKKKLTPEQKRKREETMKQIENNKKQILEYWEELPPVFISSSETGLGREEILDYIGTVLESVEEENQHPQI